MLQQHRAAAMLVCTVATNLRLTAKAARDRVKHTGFPRQDMSDPRNGRETEYGRFGLD
jgi:hypothetical protein